MFWSRIISLAGTDSSISGVRDKEKESKALVLLAALEGATNWWLLGAPHHRAAVASVRKAHVLPGIA